MKWALVFAGLGIAVFILVFAAEVYSFSTKFMLMVDGVPLWWYRKHIQTYETLMLFSWYSIWVISISTIVWVWLSREK